MPLHEPQPGQESVALDTPATRRPERATADLRPRGGGAETSSGAIVPSRREKPAETDLRTAFQPLSKLPQNAPGRCRKQWLKLAHQATTSYGAAVEPKCLERCAWQRTEARSCEIRGCALRAFNRRIFGRQQVEGEEPEDRFWLADRLGWGQDGRSDPRSLRAADAEAQP